MENKGEYRFIHHKTEKIDADNSKAEDFALLIPLLFDY